MGVGAAGGTGPGGSSASAGTGGTGGSGGNVGSGSGLDAGFLGQLANFALNVLSGNFIGAATSLGGDNLAAAGNFLGNSLQGMLGGTPMANPATSGGVAGATGGGTNYSGMVAPNYLLALASYNNSKLGKGGGTTGKGDFWGEFVSEWMDAKEQMLEDWAYKQGIMGPAVGDYNALIQDLLNQAQTGKGYFSPIKIGMGDFSTSFVPRGQAEIGYKLADLAKAALQGKSIEAEFLTPNTAEMDYLNKLLNIAKIQKGFQATEKGLEIDEKALEDKGSYLDAAGDIVDLGSSVMDLLKAIKTY